MYVNCTSLGVQTANSAGSAAGAPASAAAANEGTPTHAPKETTAAAANAGVPSLRRVDFHMTAPPEVLRKTQQGLSPLTPNRPAKVAAGADGGNSLRQNISPVIPCVTGTAHE